LASSMDEIQSNIFSMGFGPMPFYRRCSVAVQYDEEHVDGGEAVITKTVSPNRSRNHADEILTLSPIGLVYRTP
jgi:hypothetical protein